MRPDAQQAAMGGANVLGTAESTMQAIVQDT